MNAKEEQLKALYDKIHTKHTNQKKLPPGMFTVKMFAEEKNLPHNKARNMVRYAERHGLIEIVYRPDGKPLRSGRGNALVYQEVVDSTDDPQDKDSKEQGQ